MTNEINQLAAQFVAENGTPTEKAPSTRPIDIRANFFERLTELALKPAAYRDRGGVVMRACLLMPETHVSHIVAVYAYHGVFHRNEQVIAPRIAVGHHGFAIPDRNLWAWREVHGAEPRPSNLRLEITCTPGELAELVVPLFSFMDAYDKGDTLPDMPLGLNLSRACYGWTEEASKASRLVENKRWQAA